MYGREAVVIPPPVRVPSAPPNSEKRNYFLAASRLVPYKNIRAIVQAFAGIPGQRLIVAGDGPERNKLERVAGSNVEFCGFVPDTKLRTLMREARALIFAAEEDFGITMVEAQAEGTPVIALARGGARETIVTAGPTPTGLFFANPGPNEIAEAVDRFLRTAGCYLPVACWRNALRFSEDRFD